jgi:hypothetical protein
LLGLSDHIAVQSRAVTVVFVDMVDKSTKKTRRARHEQLICIGSPNSELRV